MKAIYKTGDALLSPLGLSTDENLKAMVLGQGAIREHTDVPGFPGPFFGARMDDACFDTPGLESYTKFEKMLILAAKQAVTQAGIDPTAEDVLFIMASTKGNIDFIDPEQYPQEGNERLYLWKSADLLRQFFGNPNKALVISQACISGVSAVLVARDFLQGARYRHAVVVGADTLSRFAYAGFSSLKALASKPCRPFDLNREGLNLGEAAAAMVLSSRPNADGDCVRIAAGMATNDAHHISAPSRTGEGLYQAITSCLTDFGQGPDFVNVHGTATLFNDEMESVALTRAGLADLPVTAYKGYFGHTLGAAGLLDLVLAARCMEEGLLLPVMGYETLGVSGPIPIQTKVESRRLQSCLKTASGFGGSNAALIMELVRL